MLLTAPLLSKSTFLGSLLNKCRQVIKPQKTPSTTTTNNTIKNTKNNNFTPTTTDETIPTCTNPTKSNALNTSRPALLKAAACNPASAGNNVNHISTTTVTLKTIEEKVGLPPRPKRPITPYFRYMREMRPKMVADNPKLNTTDIVRELSKKWATVDVSVKQRLQEEYKRDQEVYVEQRTKYDAKLTEDQRAEIKQMKQDLNDMKDRRKMRQRVKVLGRPKRPSSAFLLFIQRERQSTPQLPQQTYRDWHNKCTAKWSRLSAAEKEGYLKESQAEFEKYKKTLAEWEEKMMRLGNLDVVRTGSLIDPPEPKPKRISKEVELPKPPTPSKTSKPPKH